MQILHIELLFIYAENKKIHPIEQIYLLLLTKKTEAETKTIAPRKLKRRSRKSRTNILTAANTTNTALTTTSDYSPIRNPRDTGSKLGSA